MKNKMTIEYSRKIHTFYPSENINRISQINLEIEDFVQLIYCLSKFVIQLHKWLFVKMPF